jgi:hypothetical protein
LPLKPAIDELKAAIANRKALLVCGPGVSTAVAGSGAFGWKGLIEDAIDEAPKEPGEDWSARCKQNLASADPDHWLATPRVDPIAKPRPAIEAARILDGV